MSLPVSVREFAGELDMSNEDWHVFLNRRTGEFFSAETDDIRRVKEKEEDEEGELLVWQSPEHAKKVAEVLGSGDWLPLPSQFDLDEYGIMREFCETVADRRLAADLADTIGGRGTFGRFKNMVHRHNLADPWYQFRDEALRRFAVQWLKDNAIPYRDE